MIDTCKTCKYWDDWLDKNSHHGECDRIEYINSGDAIEDSAQMSVYVLDDSGLSVTLVTTADFGCSLWVLIK
jgi:hypothetical protein